MSTETVLEVEFPQLARIWGKKVLLGAALALVALGLLGQVLEHRVALLKGLSAIGSSLYAGITIGRSFWGSVVVNSVSMAILCWAACVRVDLMDGGSRRAKTSMTLVASLCVLVWSLTGLSVSESFTNFGSLTVYQAIAVWWVCAPVLVAAGSLAVGVIWVIATLPLPPTE